MLNTGRRRLLGDSRPLAGVVCFVAALITTGTPRAHALSCALPEVVVPSPDAARVPTNTLVWCSKPAQERASPIRLRDADGADVGGTQTQLSMPGSDVLVFRPASELAPSSEYTVDCPIRYQGQQPSYVFTTGSGARTTPPAVPSVANVEIIAEPDSAWGASHFARFLQAGEAQTIVVVDLVASNANMNPDAPSGFVSDVHHVFQDQDIWVGTGPCGGNWPGAMLGSTTSVALGAFDQTGAFSGWSDTITVTMPSEYAEAVADESADEADLEAESSPEPPDVSELSPVGSGDDAIDPNLDDDISAASRPSPLGRSGCALDRGASSAGISAGLLLVLSGFAARRRRSRSA